MARSALIIRTMAGVAVRGQSGEGTPGMTLRTIQTAMPTCQGEAGVIQGRRCPGARRVTLCTILGVTEAGVVRSALVICAVTGVTVRGEPSERYPCMTLAAVQSCMAAGKRKEIVLDVGTGPANGGMTLLTINRPAIGCMVRAGSTGQIVSMAKVTLDGCALELADACPEMTVFAGRDGMTTNERKACVCMLTNKPGRFPIVLTMATFTFQAHGRGMGILVTTTAASGQINRHRTTIIMTT